MDEYMPTSDPVILVISMPINSIKLLTSLLSLNPHLHPIKMPITKKFFALFAILAVSSLSTACGSGSSRLYQEGAEYGSKLLQKGGSQLDNEAAKDVIERGAAAGAAAVYTFKGGESSAEDRE